MHNRLFAFIVSLLFILSSSQSYSLELIKQYIPHTEKVGQARFKVWLWKVYDISLYAPKGDWSPNQPYALSLTYLRKIKGKDIADRSSQEMRKIGCKNEIKLAAWHAEMQKIFPNVTPGMKLTGIYLPNKKTRFYRDNTLIGQIKDPDFGQCFFSIWLSEKTSEPKLRKKLLSQNDAP